MKILVNLVGDTPQEQATIDKLFGKEYYINMLGKALVKAVEKITSRYTNISAADIQVGVKIGRKDHE